jgi:hypothetical protein
MDQKFIQKIIEKIRSISKFNSDIKDIVTQRAHISLTENGDQLTLDNIEFFNFDKVVATNKGIFLHKSCGSSDPKCICQYKNWLEFLEM